MPALPRTWRSLWPGLHRPQAVVIRTFVRYYGDMSALLAPPTDTPSVAGGVRDLHLALDRLGEAQGTDRVLGLPRARLLTEVDRAIARLQAVRLGLIAEADRAEVATDAGMAGTGSWLAAHTRTDGGTAAAQVRLATALADDLPATKTALAAGDLSPEHAAVIVNATSRLPAGLDAGERSKVEVALVARARLVDPARLRKAARRALAMAERSVAEAAAHEDAVMWDDEARAVARTRLTMHDNGDGTTTGHFTVPTLAASILRKAVQQMASPRRFADRAATGGAHTGATQRAAFAEVDWSQRYGTAFTELLEHLPTDRLHGKVAATVVVTIGLDALREQLGAAQLDTGHDVSASEARRLACEAGIVPAVMGGTSLPLDLGRADRFFTEAQRVALASVYDSCAAVGCDRPYAWCELHHEAPWSGGGRTDLRDAVPLCGHHHRRIHDRGYVHRVNTSPAGAKSVLFTRRP